MARGTLWNESPENRKSEIGETDSTLDFRLRTKSMPSRKIGGEIDSSFDFESNRCRRSRRQHGPFRASLWLLMLAIGSIICGFIHFDSIETKKESQAIYYAHFHILFNPNV